MGVVGMSTHQSGLWYGRVRCEAGNRSLQNRGQAGMRTFISEMPWMKLE